MHSSRAYLQAKWTYSEVSWTNSMKSGRKTYRTSKPKNSKVTGMTFKTKRCISGFMVSLRRGLSLSYSISSVSSVGNSSTTSNQDESSSLRNGKWKGNTQMRYPKDKRRPAQTTGPRLQVITLSEVELSRAQEEVLELGLIFSPTSHFNSFDQRFEFVCTKISSKTFVWQVW